MYEYTGIYDTSLPGKMIFFQKGIPIKNDGLGFPEGWQ